jgi:hypothetical protein
MPNVDVLPGWMWPIGSVILLVALKYLWPLMRQSMNTQLAQGRTESGLLTQVMEERDRAVQRADEADARAAKLFSEVAELRAQVKIMQFQLDVAQKQVERLTEKVGQLKGGAP